MTMNLWMNIMTPIMPHALGDLMEMVAVMIIILLNTPAVDVIVVVVQM